MSDRIKQFSLVHDAVEDRLKLSINTRESKEFQLWLTRRFVHTVWPVLIKVLESDPVIQTQQSTESRKAVLSFQHEAATQKLDFDSDYTAPTPASGSRPLGQAPLLVNSAKITVQPGGAATIAFRTPANVGLELSLEPALLHSFCRLLREIVAQSAWNLDLELGSPAAANTAAQRLN